MNRNSINFITISLALLMSCSIYAQDTIQLSDLYKAILTRNPISKIQGRIDSVYNLKQSNLNASYLPRIDVNGQATWQSDVTKLGLNLPIPGFTIPTPDNDQYKISLDLSQLIWDGGATKSKSLLEKVNSEIEKNRVDVELYGMKEKVTSLYYSIIMLDITQKQIDLISKELEKRILEIESAVKSGYLLESTLQALKAEKLKLLQNNDAIIPQRKSMLASINSITGLELNESIRLVLPHMPELSDFECVRPDYKNFSFQNALLIASSQLIAKKRSPIIAGFAQAGYGKPGLNMLSDTWDNYYIIGAKFSWNIWDWNYVSREKQQLKIQRSIVDFRKQSYLDSYSSQVRSSLLEIEKLNQQFEKDKEIVSLLHQVTERSASLLRNGTITSSVYLTDLNSESRAILDMELRAIKLSFEKVKLFILTGREMN